MTSADHAPPRATRRFLVEAWHEGVLAARAGRPLSDCPHLPPYAGADRLLALWWLRGHQVVTRRAAALGADPSARSPAAPQPPEPS
ncbi:hypothetical protein G6553_09125 [Nocardioides sp. IC4_145]|uniref:ribosome modulation factor n=1 Tax=Nocardioides sp. IC4_145 TaxID=2714037 RepID=UPI0014083E2A|nr:Rmf/CrpP family protein [Nocardioides sp. IC4_145]NHC23333.1 hypothetical protein [Nocardioides sp. IC4_145]